MIRGGDDSGGARATDRFTLGGSAMRGFERGGISVRDVAADTATSLGGERYAVVRTDLVLPVLQDREGLDTFIFADVGNVWGLNDTSAADGIANTDGKWRSSAGFGFSLSTDMGRFEAHFAIETDDQAPDLTQEFGLAFRIGY